MLALVHKHEFHGIIGTKVGKTVNGEPVHIGDVVRVAAGRNHNTCRGVVGIFGCVVGVMGLAADPLSTLKITKIIKPAKELKDLDVVDDQTSTFQARELKN